MSFFHGTVFPLTFNRESTISKRLSAQRERRLRSKNSLRLLENARTTSTLVWRMRRQQISTPLVLAILEALHLSLVCALTLPAVSEQGITLTCTYIIQAGRK